MGEKYVKNVSFGPTVDYSQIEKILNDPPYRIGLMIAFDSKEELEAWKKEQEQFAEWQKARAEQIRQKHSASSQNFRKQQ